MMKTRKRSYFYVASLLLCFGCAEEATSEQQEPAPAEAAASETEARVQEAVSFGGKPLYRFEIDAERLAGLESAMNALEQKDALSEDDYVELGRLNIAAGRFKGAIDVYTRGLVDYPQSVKLRRHRGHRYINVRMLDEAIVDLDEAVELMGDAPPQVFQYTPDGEPNGTYEHWVWYHIGLYHYLNENYDEAAAAYEKCLTTANTGNHLIGATDWLYNTYRKNGRPEDAERVIAAIPADIDASPEYSYYKRVRLYKGLVDARDILDMDKPAEDWTGGDITTGYGVANWHKFNGDEEMAQAIYDKILQTPYWSAWAYVVTDREQSR